MEQQPGLKFNRRGFLKAIAGAAMLSACGKPKTAEPTAPVTVFPTATEAPKPTATEAPKPTATRQGGPDTQAIAKATAEANLTIRAQELSKFINSAKAKGNYKEVKIESTNGNVFTFHLIVDTKVPRPSDKKFLDSQKQIDDYIELARLTGYNSYVLLDLSRVDPQLQISEFINTFMVETGGQIGAESITYFGKPDIAYVTSNYSKDASLLNGSFVALTKNARKLPNPSPEVIQLIDRLIAAYRKNAKP